MTRDEIRDALLRGGLRLQIEVLSDLGVLLLRSDPQSLKAMLENTGLSAFRLGTLQAALLPLVGSEGDARSASEFLHGALTCLAHRHPSPSRLVHTALDLLLRSVYPNKATLASLLATKSDALLTEATLASDLFPGTKPPPEG